MMRFTRLVAVSAKRSVRSNKLLVVPRNFAAASAKTGKKVSAPPLLLVKKRTKSPAKKPFSVGGKRSKWGPAARRAASTKAKTALGPYLRFVAAVKKSVSARGKRVTSMAASLWRSTRSIKDFDRRVEAAIRLAEKKKWNKSRTAAAGGKLKLKSSKGKKKKTGGKRTKTGRGKTRAGARKKVAKTKTGAA